MYTVLVADGDPLVREGLRSVIDRTGNFRTAHCVGNGEEAVAACAGSPVTMVFLSLAMPICSGLEAAIRINAFSSGTPVVFMGVGETFDFTREALRTAAMHVPIVGYLPKPVSPAAVRDILERHEALHVFGLPESVEALAKHIAEHNFPGACALVPGIAASIIAQAGQKTKYRRDILMRVNFRLCRTLDALAPSAQEPLTLPLPEAEELHDGRGPELAILRSVDAVFRLNCQAAHPLMGKVFGFIDANVASRIGLEDIVKNTAASQTHISRIFKKYFGLSTMDYLHGYKVRRAKEIFTYTSKSAAEAAYLLGYTEAGYFSKVFKKYAGVTVQQYKAGIDKTQDR